MVLRVARIIMVHSKVDMAASKTMVTKAAMGLAAIREAMAHKVAKVVMARRVAIVRNRIAQVARVDTATKAIMVPLIRAVRAHKTGAAKVAITMATKVAWKEIVFATRNLPKDLMAAIAVCKVATRTEKVICRVAMA
jgi:ABC-type transporter Mla MlaB component